jgi:hypothetical protein
MMKLISMNHSDTDLYDCDRLMGKVLSYFGVFIIHKSPQIGSSMDLNATPTYMTRKHIHFRSHYQAYIFNAYRFFYWMQ